ncbi:MAG: hypothetical protein JWP81_2150 [Ferruginibacter sp.]|nr:hypothetical protein [Ferruginibacter sp.]
MISVTGEYLINIIERHVNRTIGFRRHYPVEELTPECFMDATNEEMADFILSIPYFDESLKKFILAFSNEKTIIISQAWEIAFIVRVRKWAESDDWLHGAFRLSMNSCANGVRGKDFLTLPY